MSSFSNDHDDSYDETHYEEQEYDESQDINDKTSDSADESLEEQLNRIQKQNANLVNQAQQMQKSGSIDTSKLLEMLKNNSNTASNKGSSPVASKASSMSEQMFLIMQPFRQLRRSEVMSHVQGSVKGKVIEPFMNKNPKLYDFIVDILRSRDAIPSLAKIVDNRKKLTTFVILNICTIILGVIIKRVGRNKYKTIGQSLRKGIFVFLFILGIRLSLITGFFHSELGPIWNLIQSTFL